MKQDGERLQFSQKKKKTHFKIQTQIKTITFPKRRENKQPVFCKFYIMFFKEFDKHFQNN